MPARHGFKLRCSFSNFSPTSGKERLRYNGHAFYLDFSELKQWLETMADNIVGGEKPKDVPSLCRVCKSNCFYDPPISAAQARIEQHHEYRLAIDAQQSTLQQLLDTGDKLLDESHYR